MGAPPGAYDKQYVRDWGRSTGGDGRPPAPEVPADVVAATRSRYVEAYERITGTLVAAGGLSAATNGIPTVYPGGGTPRGAAGAGAIS